MFSRLQITPSVISALLLTTTVVSGIYSAGSYAATGKITAASSDAALTATDSGSNHCLNTLRKAALNADINATTVDSVLDTVVFEEDVVKQDRKQAEFNNTFADYINVRVNEQRVSKGREMLAKHKMLLNRLSREYGVPGHYLVAFWGLETNYGSYLGNKNAPSALATLACDPRRSTFFTKELLTLMTLVEKHKLNPGDLKSSWAGALGQTQFMPSTYARYAVDGDGDGRIDLWNSTADALASGAHYLQSLGWQSQRRWGREVQLPDNFDWSSTGRGAKKPLQHWNRQGVRKTYDRALPALTDISGSIIVPAGHKGPAFVVYDNFDIIMDWNRSENYALSVGYLADRIAGAGQWQVPAPSQARISKHDLKRLQTALNAKGFDAGKPDGIMGSGTRRALRAYQRSKDLVADGYPHPNILADL